MARATHRGSPVQAAGPADLTGQKAWPTKPQWIHRSRAPMRPHETRYRTTTPTCGALEGKGPPVRERRGERGRAGRRAFPWWWVALTALGSRRGAGTNHFGRCVVPPPWPWHWHGGGGVVLLLLSRCVPTTRKQRGELHRGEERGKATQEGSYTGRSERGRGESRDLCQGGGGMNHGASLLLLLPRFGSRCSAGSSCWVLRLPRRRVLWSIHPPIRGC